MITDIIQNILKRIVPIISLLIISSIVNAAEIKLEKINFTGKSDFPIVKIYKNGDDSWKTAKPTFNINENGIKVEGLFAASDKYLFLHLVVNDNNHNPRGNYKKAWKGDSIQIGIDALGDSPDKYVPPDFSVWDEQIAANNKEIKRLEKTTKRWKAKSIKRKNEQLEKYKQKAATPEGQRNLLDCNDAKFTIALNDDGEPTVFADKHGRLGSAGLRKDIIAEIIRDEKNKKTIYNISFPWSEFGIPKLLSTSFQVLIMVNNTTENQKERQVAVFGKNKFGLGSNFKPWYFHRFIIEKTSSELAEIIPVKTSVYNKNDQAEIIIGISGGKDQKIKVGIAGKTKTFNLSPKKRELYKLRINPQSKLPKSLVEIKINDKSFLTSIKNESMDSWWIWNPKNRTSASIIGMEKWLSAPAGKFGRIKLAGNKFKYEKNGENVKFWGVNITYANAAPKSKEIADATASRFAKYGINIVRLHKFAYGNYSGIGDPDDATKWLPDKLDKMDYFVSRLKEKGIYVLLDPFFGFHVKKKNKNDVKYFDEADKNKDTGLVNFAPDVQDLMIRKMTNLLKHKNPYTGLTYAEDPVVAIVEMQNEDDVFWGNTMNVLMKCPKYRKDFAAEFVDWLIKKYGSEKNVKKAWGNALNKFPEFERNGVKESFKSKYVLPICNPWYLSIKNIAKMQKEKNVKKRLLDTAEFLFYTQSKYYAKYEKAIRKTGYDGILESSCWQAGSDLPHYLNLYTDYKIGPIDRHNYYSGTGSWGMRAGAFNGTADFSAPGSGLLSSGMQQVADRPFVFSEWDANSPYQWRAASTTMIAYYGMGLQGWDGSMQFTARLSGFTPRISADGNVFNIEVPEGIGLYPALARTIYRNDIKEAEIVSARKINIKSLLKGKIDFDESVEQKGDLKVFTGDLPNETLAYGRTVIEFTGKPEKSVFPDITEMIKNKKIISQTKEMEWDYKKNGEEHYIINTEGTKAFAGFPPNGQIIIGNIKLKIRNRFATVIITSLDKNKTIKNAKQLLMICIARVRNSKMEYNQAETELKKVGFPPIVMEPVFAKILIPGAKKITLLNCDGEITERTKKIKNGIINVDGATDKTMYYLIEK